MLSRFEFEHFLGLTWPDDDKAICQPTQPTRSKSYVISSGPKRSSREVAEDSGVFIEPSSSKRRA